MRGPTPRVIALAVALALAGTGVVGAAASGIDGAAAVGRAAIRVDPPAADVIAHDARLDRVVELVNVERSARGLAPVAWHEQVAAAAAAHAADMAAMRRMQHAGSDGSDAGERLTRAGYSWTTWGENVAAGFTDAAALVAAWMASPGHRAHLLGDFRVIGIGAAASADGTVYWALVAAR